MAQICKKILIVDDDKEICELLKMFLTLEKYCVVSAYTGMQGIEISRKEKFDVILLDISLPDISGQQLCKLIRQESDVPIIMVSANDSVSDKVICLEYGADDYISKPFENMELIARIKAVLRRTEKHNDIQLSGEDIILFHGFKIDYKKINVYKEAGTTDICYPVIVSVPHAGRFFPEEFLQNSALSEEQLRGNEDLFVDELVWPLHKEGIPVLSMNLARSFIDVNRDKIELDSKMFYDYPEDKIAIENNRCRFGLGLIHRIDMENRPIYNGLLSYHEVQERIKNVYDVYHKRLQQLINKCAKKFGFCCVLDCHSMPSKICSIISESPRIDFCLGNLFEQSCPNKISFYVENELVKREYYVSKNRPYSGAFITFNYCEPRKQSYTLQLEINRVIYADENTLEKNNNFQRVSYDLSKVVTQLAHFLLDF